MEKTCRVLVFYGERIGDRNNLEGLAQALGWPYEMRQLKFVPQSFLAVLLQKCPTILQINNDVFTTPNVILAATGDAMRYAISIKKKAQKPIVVIKVGRPFLNQLYVDLWVQTKQFIKLPGRRIIPIDVPFHIVSLEKMAASAAHFASSLQELPRPFTTLLIGGRTGALEWNDIVAKSIGAAVNQHITKNGGSLLISTSFRTGPSAEIALTNEITVPHYSHLWSMGKLPNPFMAFLAAADQMLVTEDSASMIAEACKTNKPVQVIRLNPIGIFAKLLRQFSIFARFGREAMLLDLHNKKFFDWFPASTDKVAQSEAPVSARQNLAIAEIKNYIAKKINLPKD